MRLRALPLLLLLALASLLGRPPDIAAQEVSADLAIVLTASPDPVDAGEDIHYALTLTNLGPSTAFQVAVRLLPPTGAQAQATPPEGSGTTCTSGLDPPVCRVAILRVGEPVRFELSARMGADALAAAPGGIVSATASVASATPDPNPANDEATVQTAVRVGDLAVGLEADEGFGFPGDVVGYTVTVTNLGPREVATGSLDLPHAPSGATVTPEAAAGILVTCYTAYAPPVFCDIGHLPAGGSFRVHVLEEVSATAFGDQIRTAKVYTLGDPNPENDRASVVQTVWRNLSDDPTDSVFPDVAASTANVYVTWRDGPALGSEPSSVLFRASHDGGTSFEPVQALATADPFGAAFTPRVAASGDRVFVTFEEQGSVFFAPSEDAGASFPLKFDLTPGADENGIAPAIAAAGDRVYVVWQGNGAEGPGLYLGRNVAPAPDVFAPDTRIADPPSGLAGSYAVAAAGEHVYVAWVTDTGSGFEVQLLASSDAGLGFEPVRNLSVELGGGLVLGQTPQLAASGDDVYVSWTTASGRALLAASHDGGGSFSVTDLTANLGAVLPALAAVQGSVHVAFRANAGADLFFSTSPDGGASFGAPEPLLTGRTDLVQTPSLAAVGARVYVAAFDATPGNFEVLLTRKAAGLELRALEVVQSVQTWRNDLPLVADKETWVRAHLDYFAADTIQVKGCLRGFLGGLELPHSPLEAQGSRLTWLDPGDDAVGRRATLGATPYFRLPDDWTAAGDLRLSLALQDPERPCSELAGAAPAAGQVPALSCVDPAEPGGSAGDCTLDLTFQPTEPPEVRFVKVLWQNRAGTRHFLTDDALFDLRRRLAAIFPVARIPDFVHDGKFFIQQHYPVHKGFAGMCDFAPDVVDLCSVLTAIDRLRIMEGCGDGCRTHYLGVVPDSNLGGLAYRPGQAGSVSYYADTDTPGREFHTHELMHNLGIYHTLNRIIDLDGNGVPDVGEGKMEVPGPCGERPQAPSSSSDPPDFPYVTFVDDIGWHASISALDALPNRLVYGLDVSSPFDRGRPLVMDPLSRSLGRFATAELMSYCGGATADRDWISDVNYRAVFEKTQGSATRSAQRLAAPQSYRLIQGQVDTATGEGLILPLGRFDATTLPATPPAGDYTLELRDATGAVLASVSLGLSVPEDARPVHDSHVGAFALALPFDPQAAQVVLLHGADEVARRVASPQPPEVEVTFPNGGELLEGAETTIRWSASDADGDALTFALQYSTDDGASWRTLATDWPESELTLPLESLPGSGLGRIRVMAQDGFHVTQDESDAAFQVAGQAPRVSISAPVPDALFLGDVLIRFDAVALDSEDGAIPQADVRWTSSLDGPIGTGSAFELPASDLSEGGHVVTLSATDSAGLESHRSVHIQVFREDPDDLPPAADAGSDQSADEGTVVFLDGTRSSDREGAELGFLWSQSAGPMVALSDPRSPAPWFLAPPVDTDTPLAFRLVVNDGLSDSDPDDVAVRVIDLGSTGAPPVANAGADRTLAEGSFAALDGSGSADPEGAPLGYAWTQTGGPEVVLFGADSARPTFTVPFVSSAATLVFQLVVNDGGRDSAPDEVRIAVEDVPVPNRPPVADAGLDQTAFESAPVTLNGDGSSDPDGDALTYAWTQSEGPPVVLGGSATAHASFTAPTVAVDTELAFDLVVSDGMAGSAPATVRVTVMHRNRAPAADAGPDRVVSTGAAASLDGTGSSDFENDPLTYAWTQIVGPGVALSGADTPTPGFTAPDVATDSVLTFVLTVSDAGASRVDAVNVVVTATAPPPPSPALGELVNVSHSAFVPPSVNNSRNPQIAVSVSGVHVAWEEQLPSDVLYERSTDDGAAFEPSINLSASARPVDDRQIAAQGSDVWAVWTQQQPDGSVPTRIAHSTDGGATFAPAFDVSGAVRTGDPRIAVSGDDVYVVWRQGDEPREVFLARSGDRGAHFATPVNLSTSPTVFSETPVVAASGPKVYVVWNESYETLLRQSSDHGASFGSRVNLSQNVRFTSGFPSLVAEGSRVYVAWQEIVSGRGDIYYRRSTDAGASFEPLVDLSNNFGNSQRPQLAVSGDAVHLVWQDVSPGNEEILIRSSADGGASFGDPLDLSGDPELSALPAIAADGGRVFVVWSSEAGGFYGADSSVFARVSSDGGASFGEVLDLSANELLNILASKAWFPQPRVTAKDGRGYAVWEEDVAVSDESVSTDVFLRVLGAGGGGSVSNGAPQADAGPDREVDTGAPVVLDGSASSDPDGDVLGFSWTQLAGPPVVLSGADTAAPSFTAPDLTAPGADAVLAFQLVVDDGELASPPDAVDVLVRAPNGAPTADAQALFTPAETSLAITLHGVDPDGDALAFAVVDGPGHGTLSALTPIGPDQASVIYQPDGGYSGADGFGFTVSDGLAGSERAAVSIEVRVGDGAPIADLVARPKDGKVDLVWTPVPDAVGYDVFRSTVSGGPYERVATGIVSDVALWADLGLDNGIAYFYVVRWADAQGAVSAASNEASATPQPRGTRGGGDSTATASEPTSACGLLGPELLPLLALARAVRRRRQPIGLNSSCRRRRPRNR